MLNTKSFLTILNISLQWTCILLIAVVIFFPTPLQAQQTVVDSLLHQLTQCKEDTNKLQVLDQLIENINEDAVWLPYNEQMEKLAEQLLKNDNQKIKLVAKRSRAASYNNAGFYLEDKGDIVNALNNYYNSLKLYEEIADETGIATSLNNIGAIKDRLGDKQTALEYYHRSLKIMQQLDDKDGMAQALSNIGTVYDNQNKTDSALYYYQKSLNIRKEVGDEEGIGISLSNIGSLYDKTGNDSLALEFYNEGLKVQESIGDKVGIALSNISIGHLYMKEKKYALAEKYFLKSMQIAVEIGNLENLRVASNWLSQIYAAQGKFRDAFEMHVRYKQLTDSINNDQVKNSEMKMQARYEFEKKESLLKAEQEKKQALSKQEIEKQKQIKSIIIISSIVLIILLAFGFYNFYSRKKETFKKSVEQVNNKALRSQMNPHFIFNSLNSIQNFINSNDSENANEYLVKFAKLVRMILENSREQEIELGKDLKALELYMQLESLRLQKGFDYKINIDESIDADNLLVPPLIIQPFVENAIWHGLQHKTERGKITVSINRKGNELECIVEDNGVGRDAAVLAKDKSVTEKRKSLGMQITKERIALYNNIKNAKAFFEITDVITFNNQIGGVRVLLYLPYEEAI